MKRLLYLLPVVALVIVALLVLSGKKASAVNYVRRHHQELETYALQFESDPGRTGQYRSWDVSADNGDGVVKFCVSYSGFGSQSDEIGFYYSPGNVVCSFGNDLQKVSTDDGIKFLGNGDNYTYVEKILDRWYWYEIHW